MAARKSNGMVIALFGHWMEGANAAFLSNDFTALSVTEALAYVRILESGTVISLLKRSFVVMLKVERVIASSPNALMNRLVAKSHRPHCRRSLPILVSVAKHRWR